MATRYIRNTAILAKIESTYGTDSTPTEGANAILISNCQHQPAERANVDRDLVRPYMGASEQLVGRRTSNCRSTSSFPALVPPVPPRLTARYCAPAALPRRCPPASAPSTTW
jgi:hypothetical protein